MRTVFLFIVLATAALAGSVTEITPLFDTWGGSSDCQYGAMSVCTFNNWWSNGSVQTTKWGEVSSYDTTTWISAGKNTNYTYNSGTGNGVNWWTENEGAGWQVSNYTNQNFGNWTGSSMDSNGSSNQWGGSDSQTNTTYLLSFYNWSCTLDGKCSQDSTWMSLNQYEYSGSGWWTSFQFGEYNNSDTWKNAFKNWNHDGGTNHYTYDRYGNTVPPITSDAPEPGTWATMAAGLSLVAVGRRRPVPVRVRNLLLHFHQKWSRKR